MSPYRDIAALVADCRDGGPPVQDRLLGELLMVARDDPLAQLAVLSSLSRRLATAVSAWARGGASAHDLAELEADLVSACWAEVAAMAGAVAAGQALPERVGLVLTDRARQAVRTSRRRELRARGYVVEGPDIEHLAAGAERTAAERLAYELSGAVKAGRISAKAAQPVFLTRVMGYSPAQAAERLGCNVDVLRATRSRAERALVA